MAKEYIEREAAIERLEKLFQLQACTARVIIEAIPAADVRPVVLARWIDTDNYYQRWKCSACGCHTRDAAPNFCPNCGADMREKQT